MKKILIIIILTLFSCLQENKPSIELTILTDEMFVYCPKKECVDFSKFKEKGININDKEKNIIKFKITNNTNFTYVFIPTCGLVKNDCTSFMSFPKNHSGISLNNLEFKNSQQEIINSKGFVNNSDDLERLLETQLINYYNNMKYNYIEVESLLVGYSQEKLLIIPSKETLYFESYVSLPYNKASIFASQDFIQLNKDDSYTVSLKFVSNKINTEKRISNSQKRTFKENNYIMYDGVLKSKNSVPIVFVD